MSWCHGLWHLPSAVLSNLKHNDNHMDSFSNMLARGECMSKHFENLGHLFIHINHINSHKIFDKEGYPSRITYISFTIFNNISHTFICSFLECASHSFSLSLLLDIFPCLASPFVKEHIFSGLLSFWYTYICKYFYQHHSSLLIRGVPRYHILQWGIVR